jgi:hypothetical protein
MQLIARKLVLSVVLISSVFAQSAISAESAAPAFSPSDSGPTPETTMVGFFRWYSSGPFMHRSDPYGVNPPPPFGLEEELGQIPTTNVAGSHPLYNCFHTPRGHQDYFTSLDIDCEGFVHAQPYAYGEPSAFVMTTHVTGTVPLYRCLLQGIYHYDSLQSNCEVAGAVTEGVLGYIYQ